MNRLYIFAIGGTGARVMRSLTMLMSAGELADYEVVPILVDYDVNNGDLVQTLELMQMYKTIHDNSYNGIVPMTNGGFFSSPLTPITSITPNNLADGNRHDSFLLEMPILHHDMRVRHLLDYPLLNGNDYPFKLLLDSLFTTDLGGEMDQTLIEGFKGNAKIARLGYAAMKIQDCSGLKSFLQCIAPHNDKVVIVGSTFGGTGSVGVLEILKQLRYGLHFPINNIATVLLEPYFLPMEDPALGFVDCHSVFIKRSKDFFKFYNDSGLADFVKTTYKIGMDGFVIYESSIGGRMQRNRAHSVELLSAMAICEYVMTNQQGRYEYYLGKDYLQFGHEIIEENDFCKMPNGRRIFESLSRFLLTAKFYEEYIHGNRKIMRAHFYREMRHNYPMNQPFSSVLGAIINKYSRWLEVLSSGINNMFGLALFNINYPMDAVIRGRQYEHHGILLHLLAHDIIDDFIEKMNINYQSLRHEKMSLEQIIIKLLSESSRSIYQQFHS